MDKKIKNKWIKALRSGEYKQGKGKLYNRSTTNPKFCCLGVLCAVQGEKDFSTMEISGDWIPKKYRAGLTHDITADLAIKNDERWTFHDIADLIEIYL